MNKKQMVKHLMVREVLGIAEKHSSLYENNPEFIGLINILKKKHMEVQELFNEKELLKKPYGKIKEETWNQFALQCAQLCGFLMQVSVKKGNTEEQSFFRYTPGSFKKGPIQEVLTRAVNIVNYGERNLAALRSMKDGESLYRETVDQLEMFKKEGLYPSERRKRLKNVNQWIGNLQSEIFEFLKFQLDSYMTYFIGKSDEFYDEYVSARKLRSTKVRSESVVPALKTHQGDDTMINLPKQLENFPLINFLMGLSKNSAPDNLEDVA